LNRRLRFCHRELLTRKTLVLALCGKQRVKVSERKESGGRVNNPPGSIARAEPDTPESDCVVLLRRGSFAVLRFA
jgi:hypothetical protein